MAKLTVKDVQDLKGVRQIAFVQVARAEEAIAASEAGMDMIGTAFRPATCHYPGLVPNSHFQFGLPWGQHACAEEALRTAMEAMQAGAQSIYCGMSASIVEVLAREGVPVIAHIGLVPPKATWVGGTRAVGRDAEQAANVFHAAKDFEAAGAFALELEVVPQKLAAYITKQTTLTTISLGSGPDCDATYLFSADLLGENTGHIPRHAKVYRNFAAERARLQNERIAAYKEYIDDVQDRRYPQPGNTVSMEEKEFQRFLDSVRK
ncbi:MAG: 3-methyl-2-oxobutanoate hydroxymethyltransferase [Acidiferrobacterales bacterium]|nr:3-methyl-2-oxobutanoate hydroxymethyltransferase [Acidiferrobacterales bacterium]